MEDNRPSPNTGMRMVWTDPSPLRPLFPWILWRGPAGRNAVYVTFDDGPHPEHTPAALEILRAHGASATFFVNGARVLLHPGPVRAAANAGHGLGNHGFSHARLSFRPARSVLEEIRKTDAVILRAAGRTPYWFRPPYGRFDPRFRSWMTETRHGMALWSLLSLDYREPSPAALVRRVLGRLHPGAVIVLHDGHDRAPVMRKALPAILDGIRNAGFAFETLDALNPDPAHAPAG